MGLLLLRNSTVFFCEDHSRAKKETSFLQEELSPNFLVCGSLSLLQCTFFRVDHAQLLNEQDDKFWLTRLEMDAKENHTLLQGPLEVVRRASQAE